jgi:hypothetical protein
MRRRGLGRLRRIEFLIDGQRLPPGLQRDADLVGTVEKASQLEQSGGLAVPVAGLAANGERLLEVGLGMVEPARLPVDSAEVVQRESFTHGVTQRSGQGQCPLLDSKSVAELAQSQACLA